MMGVRGLTTFIDCHPHLLSDHKLHNTRLIIDGNNLYHFLYYYFKVPHQYGGDYQQFSTSCETFFSALESCHIEPYVIFDGAYEADGNKFKTSMERARERIRLAGLLSTGVHAKILPILTHSAFCHILTRLRIPHVTCDFEADQQIAALAICWNCPVLTNDSDFFIYDIPAGVMLLDYLDLHVRRNKCSSEADVGCEYRYLAGQMFFVKNMMKFLHITDHSLVVLLATVLGNDLIDGRHFDSFFARAKLPKAVMKKLSAKRQIKIASAVGWLQNVRSVNEGVSFVLSHLPEDKRVTVETLINGSLRSYVELTTELDKYFGSLLPPCQLNTSLLTVADGTQSCLVTPSGTRLPDWFITNVRCCYIPAAMLNVIVSRRLLFLCQVELMNESSSYDCSQQLRSIVYGILLSLDVSATSQQTDKMSVVEYTREHRNLKHVTIEPTWQLHGKPVPALENILEISDGDRFKFLVEALSSPCDSAAACFTRQVTFIIGIVRYWIVNVRPKVTVLHVHALLLCLLKLSALDSIFLHPFSDHTGAETLKLSTTDPLTTSSEVSAQVVANENIYESPSCIDKSSCHALDSAKVCLEKFCSAPRHNNVFVFDTAAVHAFCQFQTCLQAACQICQLLLLFDVTLDPAVVFSGTLLYNLLRDLRSRTDSDMYICELLGKNVYHSYRRVLEAICTELPTECFKALTLRSKKKKTKTKEKQTVNNENSNNLTIDETSLVTSGYADELLVANCDLDNKFSCLLLMDS